MHGRDDGVVVRDVEIPFLRLVGIILKFALASIPALILASLVMTLTAAFIAAFIGASIFGTNAADGAGESPPYEVDGGALPPLNP